MPRCLSWLLDFLINRKERVGIKMKIQKKSFNKKQIRIRQLRRRVIEVSVVTFIFIFFAGWGLVLQKRPEVNKQIIAAEVKTKVMQESGDNTQFEPKNEESKEEITSNVNIENEIKRVVDPSKPMIALTFDDGPGEGTMEILKVLERYQARATFFVCGNGLSGNAENVSEILNKMDELGCDIGNHTMNHRQLDILSPKQIKKEVDGVNKIINKYTGHGAKFLRPPYGAGIRDRRVAKSVDMAMVCWSVDTLDWKTKSKKETMKAVLKDAEDGDIVLMHDIHRWSVDAAIEIIPRLVRKGYQLVTVSEMAEARGVRLEKGKPYFEFK